MRDGRDLLSEVSCLSNPRPHPHSSILDSLDRGVIWSRSSFTLSDAFAPLRLYSLIILHDHIPHRRPGDSKKGLEEVRAVIMSLTPFYIPDSSPILSYSGPGGWHSAYTPRGDGYDQTFHQVSGPGNEVAFNLTCEYTHLSLHSVRPSRDEADKVAAGFTVSHATVAPGCPLEYSINGTEFRSTCDERGGLKDLKYGLHQVVLRTGNVTVFQLFGVVGSYTKAVDQE